MLNLIRMSHFSIGFIRSKTSRLMSQGGEIVLEFAMPGGRDFYPGSSGCEQGLRIQDKLSRYRWNGFFLRPALIFSIARFIEIPYSHSI